MHVSYCNLRYLIVETREYNITLDTYQSVYIWQQFEIRIWYPGAAVTQATDIPV